MTDVSNGRDADSPQPILVDCSLVDWELLRKQKEWLLLGDTPKNSEECLEGLLGLLDHIQDSAALQIGSRVVFGPEPEDGQGIFCLRCGRDVVSQDGNCVRRGRRAWLKDS